MKRFLCFLLLLSLQCRLSAQVDFELVTYASGFNQPVDITNAGDDRLFVVEKRGVIRILNANGEVLPTPFLDIDARVSPSSGEQGLLGLAFHPD